MLTLTLTEYTSTQYLSARMTIDRLTKFLAAGAFLGGQHKLDNNIVRCRKAPIFFFNKQPK